MRRLPSGRCKSRSSVRRILHRTGKCSLSANRKADGTSRRKNRGSSACLLRLGPLLSAGPKGAWAKLVPTNITITSNQILQALEESIEKIVETVKLTLEKTPPELASDIIDKGIVLTGGGSLVDGFSQLLSQELKVPVFIAESPLTCVAEGTGILLDNLHMLDR